MISLKELLSGHVISDIEHSHQINLEELLRKINVIRAAWNHPMTVTSGYRSRQDHLRIYSVINAKRRENGIPELVVPMNSKHLIGAACDISDPDGSLFDWCKDNETLLVSTGLYCEEQDSQARVHFQIFPPLSGKRFFNP